MRLPVLFLGLACALAACADSEETIEVTLVDLPPETTHLDMTGARLNEARTYRLNAVSRSDQSVEFTARLLDPVPAGMSVRVRGEKKLLPRGSGVVLLTIALPPGPGPFQGSVELSAAAVSWSRTLTFAGEVTDRPLPGPRIRWDSVDLGDVRPGERRAFTAAIHATGADALVITDLAPEDPARVQIAAPAAERIESGAALQVHGTATAPREGGPFRSVIRIVSNANNVRGKAGIVVFGTVVPDYAPLPPRLGPKAHYPVQEPTFRVVVRGRKGTAPFTIGAVVGHERLFRVVESGTKEPAHEQSVALQLKRDAPTDAAETQTLTVRFRLAPGGTEVSWPVALRLYPPIHPEPAHVHFGRVTRGAPATKEIRLAAFANRNFTVKSAMSRRGVFQTSIKPAAGLPWRIVVLIPNGTPSGLLQDTIVIETDDPDVPKILVPVKADLR